MAARNVFLLLVLPTVLCQPMWHSKAPFPSVNPWAGLQGYPGLSSPEEQQDGVSDDDGVYQDDGTYGDANVPRAIEDTPHGTPFGGDYGFPRYGGRCRVSRYGIDYGDFRARRRGGRYRPRRLRRNYGRWLGALAYGTLGNPEVYGRTYSSGTGLSGGQEHPTAFDPYLANLYYTNPFALKRLLSWFL